jgi:hypothetical protein
MQLWDRAVQTAVPVRGRTSLNLEHFREFALQWKAATHLVSLLWPYLGCLSVSFLEVSLGDCQYGVLGIPQRTAPYILTSQLKIFFTQTSTRAVDHTGGKVPINIKTSAGPPVRNYLFQLSVKGGAFYSSQAEIWQFPSCEILLTKVLNEGQRNVVCRAPAPSSLWPGHVSGPGCTDQNDFDLMTIKGQSHNGIRCVSGGWST